MIFVDELREYPNRGVWCHMWTDGDISELHAFAHKLGLKRPWLHADGGGGRFPHYDLSPSKRRLAVKMGAIFMPARDAIRKPWNNSNEQ